MNYLAHSYLTPKNSNLLIGNFIGDFVKGKISSKYPSYIIKGIELHRFIDFYTDNHQIVRQHNKIMQPKLGLLSGVATDMIYDYILGENWMYFSNISIEKYIQDTYNKLNQNKFFFPKKFESMFYYMKKDNWLLAYSTQEGMKKALKGLSNRISFCNNLPYAWDVFKENESKLTEEFKIFIGEIKKEIALKFK